MAKKSSKSKEPSGPATIQNKRARHDYEFLDTYEAGMELQGSEVKSLFLGRAALVDAYVSIRDEEAWLCSLDIEPYKYTTTFQPERRRERKLLLHKQEIRLLDRKVKEKGLSIIPIKIYFKKGRAKVEIGLARGKKQYDKRETLKKKDEQRRISRGLED
jgi:SsrA-binding protein